VWEVLVHRNYFSPLRQSRRRRSLKTGAPKTEEETTKNVAEQNEPREEGNNFPSNLTSAEDQQREDSGTVDTGT
jgi:hypothetical protein